MLSDFFLSYFFYYISTMPHRGKKSKGGPQPRSPLRREPEGPPKGRKVRSSPLQEPLNDLDISGHKVETEKDTLTRVIDILIDIFNRLEVHEKGMEELKVSREEAPGRVQSMSATRQTTHAGRGRSCQ